MELKPLKIIHEDNKDHKDTTIDMKIVQENNKFFTYDEIKRLYFRRFKNVKEPIEFKYNESIIKLEHDFTSKLKSSDLNEKNIDNFKLIGIKRELKHDKYAQDNVVKKVKVKFFNSLINFLSNALNYLFKTNTKYFRKPDYKTNIENLCKKHNMDLFEKNLFQFLSKQELEKINSYPKEGFPNFNIAKALLELTVQQYLDIYTYKKFLRDYIPDLDEDLNFELMRKFRRIDDILNEMYHLDDTNYASIFIYLTFNLRAWFSIKVSRQKKRVKNDK